MVTTVRVRVGIGADLGEILGALYIPILPSPVFSSPLPSFFFPSTPFPDPLLSSFALPHLSSTLSLPLEVGPLNIARGSGGAL